MASGSSPQPWLTIPTPLRHLYKLFPLLTLPPAPLPARCSTPSSHDQQHPTDTKSPLPSTPTTSNHEVAASELHVFTDAVSASAKRPSFNPSCLRIQTLCALAGLPITLDPSSNHASPSGSLPFLVPTATSSDPHPAPIVKEKDLVEFVTKHATSALLDDAADNHRTEAYQALIDGPIRCAWLHSLYLCRANRPLLERLCALSTTSPLVRSVMVHQLRAAAAAEIETCTRSATTAEDVAALYADARDAFGALDQLLSDTSASHGDGEAWFSGASTPQLFDAHIFAYTALILAGGGDIQWPDRTLSDLVHRFPRLVSHHARMAARVRPHLVVW